MTLEEFAQLLETADERVNAQAATALTRAADDLTDYAQSIMHRVSGHMAESTYRLGPFPIPNGLEVTIQSAAPYAVKEVEKGGDHDWATRTIVEQQARIDQLASEVAELTATALVGK